MPLPIAHGFLGAGLVAAIHPKPTGRLYLPLLIGAFLANAADFDFGFSLFFGLKGWHRGFTHSIFFALIFTLVLIISFKRNYFCEALAYGLSFTSHCILDFATTQKGHGVEFLFPFTTDRFGLRWFSFSEITSGLSLIKILNIIGLEFLIFAPFLVLAFGLRTFMKKNEAKSP